jgi:hypothetical protein
MYVVPSAEFWFVTIVLFRIAIVFSASEIEGFPKKGHLEMAPDKVFLIRGKLLL